MSKQQRPLPTHYIYSFRHAIIIQWVQIPCRNRWQISASSIFRVLEWTTSCHGTVDPEFAGVLSRYATSLSSVKSARSVFGDSMHSGTWVFGTILLECAVFYRPWSDSDASNLVHLSLKLAGVVSFSWQKVERSLWPACSSIGAIRATVSVIPAWMCTTAHMPRWGERADSIAMLFASEWVPVLNNPRGTRQRLSLFPACDTVARSVNAIYLSW
jgi:hypothetical protein